MSALPQTPALYVGRVMHHRMKPKVHRFAYDVFSCLLDLDRLDDADKASRVFSVDRVNLIAFHQKDHGEKTPHPEERRQARLEGCAKPATSSFETNASHSPQDEACSIATALDRGRLAAYARTKLAAIGAAHAGHRILLLAYPRVLNFVFNPLSIYYCFDVYGALGAMIYEVSNTFGERHSYVAPVRAGEFDDSGLRQERDKAFYVSPFLDMPLRYKFRLAVPDDTLRFRILEEDARGPILAATFSAQRRALTTADLLRAFAKLPWMTAKVVAAIHWEALRLWLKGVRHVPKPQTVAAPIASKRLRRGAP